MTNLAASRSTPPQTNRTDATRLQILSPDLHKTMQLQAGLLSRKQLLDSGLTRQSLRHNLTTGLWQRVVRGVYEVVPHHEWPNPHDIRRKAAAWTGLLAVNNAISTGMCALALHGVWGLPSHITPEVCLPGGSHREGPKGVTIRRYRKVRTATLEGRRIATPVHAIAQALPLTTRDTGVCLVDSALNLGLIQQRDLLVINGLLHGRHGGARARTWLLLANGLAQSPFETRVRLQCHDAGLPAPHLQVKIRDASRVIAYGDLGWQRADGSWVLVDLDGKAYHEAPAAIYSDRHRQNAIALSGQHTHLRFTWSDYRENIIPATIRKALHSFAPPQDWRAGSM